MKKIEKMMRVSTATFNQNKRVIATTLVVLASSVLIPYECFAAGSDAFAGILTKANGWVGGSAGKLITFCSLAIAGVMGVAGFPAKQVAGAVGVGLLLSSANSIVEMIF